MHIVAASYQQHYNDQAGFAAALKPRGLAARPINFLWWLITSQTEDRWSLGDIDNGSEGDELANEDSNSEGRGADD